MIVQLDLYPIDKERQEQEVPSILAIKRARMIMFSGVVVLPLLPPRTPFIPPDEHPCTGCGRMILTVTTTSYIASEFCDSEGRCWDCNREGKK